MKAPDKFEDYVKKGIVKKQRPDFSRATHLQKVSEISKLDIDNRINDEGPTDINANALIKESYDLVMELIRSKMLALGYNSLGLGAHEAEVAFLRNLKFIEKDVLFWNKVRKSKNGITYYGNIFDKTDAENVISFLKKIYPKLKQKTKIN
jgi:hypothetical protein